MKEVAKHYFSHPSVWAYIIIGTVIGYSSFYFGFIQKYYYVLFIPVIIAPFFEWFAHKYVLHAQIGNVIDFPLQAGAKKGGKVIVPIYGEDREMEVLSIGKDNMTIGYGWSRKLPFIRKFMYVLHYGHHEDPNKIELIFAPISSVIILFAALFGVAFLFTFTIAIASVFLLGVVIYYLHYEWMHLGHHIPGYKHIFSWNNRLKTAHQLHHYRNENYWWGITNSLGDRLFGTYKKHNEVTVSPTIKNINSR